ncbi:hypothetical protein A9Q99_02035 [Gammaproteobacteria bacterium 45_16_T64]|nr:hypothetical protein A9Q99_02035 [Gammaproteobacteria bacterium 45_16_T64]
MKKSARAIRMDRRQKRQGSAGINLVSLMDIFTILVFFLLVNSSTTAQPPNAKVIELPTSLAEKLPKETLTIMVSKNSIIVNGRAIVGATVAMLSTGDTIAALQQELLYQASKTPAVVNELGIAERDVTIMGDKSIPYKLLRKIMMTCSAAEFSKISLAVLKKPEDEAS